MIDPYRMMPTDGSAEKSNRPIVHAWCARVNINATHCRTPALLYEMWGVYEIDLWLRYKSKAVDLVRFNRTCKVSLRAGRGRGAVAASRVAEGGFPSRFA